MLDDLLHELEAWLHSHMHWHERTEPHRPSTARTTSQLRHGGVSGRSLTRAKTRNLFQDAIWQHQQAQAAQPQHRNRPGGVLRVPFVKFLLRTLLELLFLLVYAVVLLLGPTGSALLVPTALEALLYGWSWGLILDEYYQYRTASDSLAEHFDSLWNRIDLLKLSTLGIASATHLFVAIPLNALGQATSGYQVLGWSRVVLAVGALPAFTRVFAAISLDQKYGVLFLSCARMFDDIKRFMVLLGIVMLAFGLTFSGLASANLLLLTHGGADGAAAAGVEAAGCGVGASGAASATGAANAANATCGSEEAAASVAVALEDPPMTSPSRGFLLALWAIHGEMIGHEVAKHSPPFLNSMPAEPYPETAEPTLCLMRPPRTRPTSRSALLWQVVTMPRMATGLLWVYFMLSQIVLLNLLVAIMGDTWQQIRENADDEWKYLKVNAIAEYFELHHIPPPFNAARLLRALFDGSFGENTEEPWQRCTRKRTAADVKKLSKDAQRDLLKAWRLEAEMERGSQLRSLQARPDGCREGGAPVLVSLT